MFGWFKPKCPISLTNRLWCEEAIELLLQSLGLQLLQTYRVVHPIDSRFNGYRGSDECVLGIFYYICDVMSVPRDRVEFIVVPNEFAPDGPYVTELPKFDPGFLGLYLAPNESYSRPRIWIRDHLRKDPQRLVAVIAHELAHDVTFTRWPAIYNESDYEQLTDLVPVLFGLGIFMANSTFRYSSENFVNYTQWKSSRSGYLDLSVFGYALAVIAHLRGDTDFSWSVQLRPNALEAFQSGMKFLQRTQDRLLDPSRLGTPRSEWTRDELAAELDSNQPCRQLRALGQIRTQESLWESLFERIVPFLSVKETAIRAIACEIVLRARSSAVVVSGIENAFMEALDLLLDSEDEVRVAAIKAIWPDCPNLPVVAEALVVLIRDRDSLIAEHACQLLCNFPDKPARTAAAAQACFDDAILQTNEPLMLSSLRLLESLNPGAFTRIKESGLYPVECIRHLQMAITAPSTDSVKP